MLSIIPLLLLQFACSKPEVIDWSANHPLSSVDVVSPDGFSWKNGDMIKVFSFNEKTGDFQAVYKALSAGDSVSFAPLLGSSTVAERAEKYYACYPSDAIVFDRGGGILPEEYECVGGKSEVPMSFMVKNDDVSGPGSIHLSMCCSVMEITLSSRYSKANLNSVTLKSDALLSGSGRFSETGGVPFIKIARGVNQVKYKFTGVTLDGEFTFRAVLPANVKIGNLEIVVETSGKTFSRTISGFNTGIGNIFKTSIAYPEVYNQKIYESDTYASFADLIWYGDRYYCAFREGVNHVPSSASEPVGKIHILQSYDCREWKDACIIADDNYDLRDPHFCISPKDGSLMCYYGLHKYNESFPSPSKTRVSVLDPTIVENTLVERFHSGLNAGEYSRWWVWNLTVSGDTIYGVAYYQNGCNVALLSSKDGFDWELVSEIPYQGNEASINIIDGKAYVLMRKQENSGYPNGSMAVSDYPFKDWIVTEMNYGVHSPAGIEYGGKLYLCTRKFVNKAWDGVSLFSYDLPSSGSLNEVYSLPCERGQASTDNAYAGMIIRDGVLRIAYYANPVGNTINRHPDIYYTEIPLDVLEQNPVLK